MKHKRVFVTFTDRSRLLIMLDAYEMQFLIDVNFIQILKRDLIRAVTVAPEHMPKNVITMNSRIRLRNLAIGRDQVATLTYPHEVVPGGESICILSPLGSMLLGHTVGDVIECPQKLRVEEIIYQPEAVGEYICKNHFALSF